MRRQSNENVYERLGVRTIVNASGPSTRLSGGILRPEVAAAMAEASQWCVDLAELQARASEVLADATGAESGYVTAGAAAGLMLAAAACVAKLDPARMNRLPDTAGMQNEIIIARSQRNMYDHAVVQAGAKLVEIGIPDRFSGAGVRDTQAWEYEAAANERTAAILWVAQPHSEPKLPDVVSVARRRGLPIIVDAAGQLPPAENLKRFVSEGGDLVVFSGGKAIGGPQASGILVGRRDLIQSAALQQLDHDTYFEQWSPPPSLFDKSSLPGLPASGVGQGSEVRQGGDRRALDGAEALPHRELRRTVRAVVGLVRGNCGRPEEPARHDRRSLKPHLARDSRRRADDPSRRARLLRARSREAPSGRRAASPRQSRPGARWCCSFRAELLARGRFCSRDRTCARRARLPRSNRLTAVYPLSPALEGRQLCPMRTWRLHPPLRPPVRARPATPRPRDPLEREPWRDRRSTQGPITALRQLREMVKTISSAASAFLISSTAKGSRAPAPRESAVREVSEVTSAPFRGCPSKAPHARARRDENDVRERPAVPTRRPTMLLLRQPAGWAATSISSAALRPRTCSLSAIVKKEQ
jgi:hypothetical protein